MPGQNLSGEIPQLFTGVEFGFPYFFYRNKANVLLILWGNLFRHLAMQLAFRDGIIFYLGAFQRFRLKFKLGQIFTE
jgi:hypothetical protein